MTKPVKIAEAAMQQADMVQLNYFVNAPAGTVRESALVKEFWVHVSRKLKPMARVTVLPDDGSWYQELLCIVADGPDIRMKELGFWSLDEDLSDVGASVVAGYEAQWAGPSHQFRVIRVSDGAVAIKGLPTMADARRWIADNSRKSAA